MDPEFLRILWFILIAVLWTGFFFLEGFDYGVGILLPFVAQDETDRRVVINTIGPFWDGNEVWLLTAGGAIFAAFPNWYATLFSGFYLALAVVLVALIMRGVAFEFRSKNKKPEWRAFWDWAIFGGSLVPALLMGVAFGNLLQGVPINEKMQFTGNFFSLLSPYTLIAGVYGLVLMTLHGAIYLSLKAADAVAEKAHQIAGRLWPIVLVVFVVTLIASNLFTDMFSKLGVIPLLGLATLSATGWFIRNKRHGWAFAMTGVTIAMSVITIFLTLFPRVMVSSANPAYSLTIQNASSSPYTLSVMSVVALIFVPIVLVYQGWTYYTFRNRVTRQSVQNQA